MDVDKTKNKTEKYKFTSCNLRSRWLGRNNKNNKRNSYTFDLLQLWLGHKIFTFNPSSLAAFWVVFSCEKLASCPQIYASVTWKKHYAYTSCLLLQRLKERIMEEEVLRKNQPTYASFCWADSCDRIKRAPSVFVLAFALHTCKSHFLLLICIIHAHILLILLSPFNIIMASCLPYSE